MAVLSRSLRRWDPIRLAGAVLGLAWLVLLGAFAYAATFIQPSSASLAAAAAALLIAASGFLYAWREPGR